MTSSQKSIIIDKDETREELISRQQNKFSYGSYLKEQMSEK